MSNSTRNWRSLGRDKRQRIRHEVCERHNWRCFYCGHDFLQSLDDFLQLTLDHVVPLSEGGAHCDPDNLVPCCNTCNQLKGSLVADSLGEMRDMIATKKLERSGDYWVAIRLRRRRRRRRVLLALTGCFTWLAVLWPWHSAT